MCLATLLLATGFALQAPLGGLRAAQATPAFAPARLCAPAEESAAPEPSMGGLRSYDKTEEKALRQTRLDFGGYPAGKYYTLEQQEGPAAAYAQVRKDHPALSGWSDGEIQTTVESLKSTPAELLIYSPLGPFLVLSAISIWRDGLSAWGIPPCSVSTPGICGPNSLLG